MGKKKKQKQKLEVVFDPAGRREFLTGFHKRKIERKKRAKTELNELLKNEKKRIRQEVKDSVKLFKKSYEPCPDVQHLIDEEEYEDDVVQVKVVDLAAENIASRYNFIGQNKPKYSDDEKESDDEPEDDTGKGIPGMELKEKKVPIDKPALKIDPEKIKSKKDLNRFTKKTSNQSVRRNKLFKMKAKLDSVAGRKKARNEKKRNEKMRTKKEKRRGKPRGR